VAINVKSSMNAIAAIKKIGIPQDLFDWLVLSPVQVTLTAKAFVLSVPQMSAPVEVAVQLNDLQKLSQGTLDPTSKHALAQLLATAIQDIKLMLSATTLAEQGSFASTLDKLPPLEPDAPKAEEPPVKAVDVLQLVQPNGLWMLFDEKTMKTAPLTKLRDANQMYQPVFGTSGGSRYYVVAGGPDIRVAARLAGGSLSIRIEGPNFSAHAAKYKALGLKNGGTGDYASIHLDVGKDPVMASKTLGAVLMGLGIPFETPLPELKRIAGC
jgi:hypothetical protein